MTKRAVYTCMILSILLPIAAYADGITLATWNIRILSDGSRDDDELAKIAQIMGRYDFIAMQEACDTRVLDRLMRMLPEYTYVASRPVGRGVKEIYAFVYKEDLFERLGDPILFPDAADDFIREPYVGHFRSGEFDFTVVTIHLLYGDSASERRKELRLMDEIVRAVDQANGAEDDVLLMGDFNFNSADDGWELATWEHLVEPHMKTTITDTNSYDNIWYDPQDTQELVELLEILAFDELMFGNDDRRASLEVSDHRPVAALFDTSGPDDDPDGDYRSRIQPLGVSDDTAPVDDGTDADIRIERVVAHPTDEESVTLKNYGPVAVNLGGWIIGDENDRRAYWIPNGNVIDAGASIVFRRSWLGFGINNSGEAIYLWNPNNELVDAWEN